MGWPTCAGPHESLWAELRITHQTEKCGWANCAVRAGRPAPRTSKLGRLPRDAQRGGIPCRTLPWHSQACTPQERLSRPAAAGTCDSPEVEPTGLGEQTWKRGGLCPRGVEAMTPPPGGEGGGGGYCVVSWAVRPDGCRCRMPSRRMVLGELWDWSKLEASRKAWFNKGSVGRTNREAWVSLPLPRGKNRPTALYPSWISTRPSLMGCRGWVEK